MANEPNTTPQSTHEFDPGILREYDIRGVVGETLTEDDAYAVGQVFGTVVRRRNEGDFVCVGFDGRESSPGLTRALMQGLASTGLKVENVGIGPTPMVYYAFKNRGAGAGLIVTGSHSPLEYNGIKMALKSGPFYGAAIQELGRMAAEGDIEQGHGEIVEVDIREEYIKRLLQDYQGDRDLKVAWDCGNGAAGSVLRLMTDQLPGTHEILFEEVDGTFPNHHPDPTVAKNLVDLQRVVTEKGYDLGIGFDGDGDRIGVVDEKGGIIWADVLMAIYAREVLRDHPGATVIGDVKCSRVFFDEIRRLGGEPVMWNTGHSLIKAKMAETGAPLAGELAGHICFSDKFYGVDDGLYCAIRLLSILASSEVELSALTAHLPKMQNTPEVRFHVPASRKFDIAPEIRDRLKEDARDGVDVNDIDGVRVTTQDGWWLMRPSNTEDVITVRAEAFTPEGLETLKAELVEQLKLSGISSPFET